MNSTSLTRALIASCCALAFMLPTPPVLAANLTTTYQANYNFSSLPGSTTVELPQWNSAVFPSSILLSASLRLNTLIEADATGENDASIGGPIFLLYDGTMGASAPSGLSPSVHTEWGHDMIVSRSDGVPGSGPDFRTWLGVSIPNSATTAPTHNLNPYMGSQTFTANVNGSGAFSIFDEMGPSTLHVNRFSVTGSVEVTYTYTAPVPEPSSFLLAAFGVISLCVWCRPKR